MGAVLWVGGWLGRSARVCWEGGGRWVGVLGGGCWLVIYEAAGRDFARSVVLGVVFFDLDSGFLGAFIFNYRS